MLYTAGRYKSVEEAKKAIEDALHSGKGLQKLREMIAAQGGDEKIVDDPNLLPIAKRVIPVKSEVSGYILSTDAQAIGASAMLLGAGRNTKEDVIDPSVGIVVKKRIGEKVEAGNILAEFYVNDDKHLEEAMDLFKKAIKIGAQKADTKPLIYGVVTEDGIERWS